MSNLSEKLRERIDECVRFMSEIDEAVFDKAVQKLAYYEDLEEAGRLVVLPCKVGDTVWMIVTRPAGSYIRRGRLTRKNLFRVVRDLGKTLFLTREEAEKALEGMK